MSGYENVVGGKLKLKGKALDVKAGGLKKKKKNKKRQDQISEVTENELPPGSYFLFISNSLLYFACTYCQKKKKVEQCKLLLIFFWIGNKSNIIHNKKETENESTRC